MRRDVEIKEYFEAGAKGRALLVLVAQMGKNLVTGVTQKMCLSTPDNPKNGQMVDVTWVGFPDYSVSRMAKIDGFLETESGFTAESIEGVPQALKNLFEYYAAPQTVIEYKPSDAPGQKQHFRYRNQTFERSLGLI